MSQEAISLGRDLGHLPSTLVALVYKIDLETMRNEPESVVTDAENLLTIGLRHNMEVYVLLSRLHLSWARGRLGDARRGADELRELLAVYTGQGNRIGAPVFLGCLARTRS